LGILPGTALLSLKDNTVKVPQRIPRNREQEKVGEYETKREEKAMQNIKHN